MALLFSPRLHYTLARTLTVAGALFAGLTITTGSRSGLETEDAVCVIYIFTYFALDIICSLIALPLIFGKRWQRMRDEGRRVDIQVDHAVNYFTFILLGDALTVPIAIFNAMQAYARLSYTGRYPRKDWEHNYITDVAAAFVWLGVYTYVFACHAELFWTLSKSSRRIRLMADEQLDLDDESDEDATTPSARVQQRSRVDYLRLALELLQSWELHYLLSRGLAFLAWIAATATVIGTGQKCSYHSDQVQPITEPAVQLELGAILLYGSFTIYAGWLLYTGRLRDFREQGSFSKHGKWTRFACIAIAFYDVMYTNQTRLMVPRLQKLYDLPADTFCDNWDFRSATKATITAMTLHCLTLFYCSICQLDLLRRGFLSWRMIRAQRRRQLAEEQTHEEEPSLVPI